MVVVVHGHASTERGRAVVNGGVRLERGAPNGGQGMQAAAAAATAAAATEGEAVVVRIDAVVAAD